MLIHMIYYNILIKFIIKMHFLYMLYVLNIFIILKLKLVLMLMLVNCIVNGRCKSTVRWPECGKSLAVKDFSRGTLQGSDLPFYLQICLQIIKREWVRSIHHFAFSDGVWNASKIKHMYFKGNMQTAKCSTCANAWDREQKLNNVFPLWAS